LLIIAKYPKKISKLITAKKEEQKIHSDNKQLYLATAQIIFDQIKIFLRFSLRAFVNLFLRVSKLKENFELDD